MGVGRRRMWRMCRSCRWETCEHGQGSSHMYSREGSDNTALHPDLCAMTQVLPFSCTRDPSIQRRVVAPPSPLAEQPTAYSVIAHGNRRAGAAWKRRLVISPESARKDSNSFAMHRRAMVSWIVCPEPPLARVRFSPVNQSINRATSRLRCAPRATPAREQCAIVPSSGAATVRPCRNPCPRRPGGRLHRQATSPHR